MESIAAERIAAHRASGSDGRWNHHGLALHETTPLLQRRVTERSRCPGGRCASRIINRKFRGVTPGRRCCSGKEERNRVGLEPAEVVRIPDEVPALLKLRDSRWIGATAADHAPWQGALNRNDGSQLPALQHLRETLFGWKGISDSRRQALADVEIAARIITAEISRRSIGTATFAGLLVQRMGKRETDSGGKPVASALG